MEKSTVDPVTQRNHLADALRATGALHSPSIEEAFRRVPRHVFVPHVPAEVAYSDKSIPLKTTDGTEAGLLISSSSQPMVLALMLEQAALMPGQRVLEIGTGSGYNAALMAHLVGAQGEVITVDIDADLITVARQRLDAAGFERVRVVCIDGMLGYPAGAPYDRIIVTVGVWDLAPAWRDQLRPQGRLVVPLIIAGMHQESLAFEPESNGWTSVSITDCSFMLLQGPQTAPVRIQPLGPQPGLYLSADYPVEAQHIYDLLLGSYHDEPTGVTVTAGEVYGGLGLWLGLQEPRLFELRAVGALAGSELIPTVVPVSSHARVAFTKGLATEQALCVLTRRKDAHSFELVVRSYGAGEALKGRLAEQIRRWESAGRPTTKQFQIKALSREGSPSPPGEHVVEKQFSRLVWSWILQ